jgi:thiol-disulfide isomerase/thioredoxin
MRFSLLLGAMFMVLNARGETAASREWIELKTKRLALSALHQEFQVKQTLKTARSSQDVHREIILDISEKKWRERSFSGSGDHVRIFDGQDLFVLEAEGDEYVRTKDNPKGADPEPEPYGSVDLDWPKATEVNRQPCLPKNDRSCIIFEVPVKKWMRMGRNRITRLVDGVSRLAIESETGVLIQSNVQEIIDDERGVYQLNLTCSLRQMSYGVAARPELFKLPDSGVHEVKEFTKWNAGRIKKKLAGNPAPELQVTDIAGNPLSLSNLNGKTVLLDFWTTWCPPCVADGPALEKLYQRYGNSNLTIIGISVNEERDTVEKFLHKHPHSFPVVLSSENEMPRAYQIGVFPTYIVIAPDGTLTTAVEGDQGFGELRDFLKKAGLETE